MTQKELLYLEDAYNHENNIINIIEESINYLQDNTITSYLKDDLKKHKSMKDKIIKLMESIHE